MAVRFYEVLDAGNGRKYYKGGYCDPEAEKPVGTGKIAVGSDLTVVETGSYNLYSEASEDWVQQFTLQV